MRGIRVRAALNYGTLRLLSQNYGQDFQIILGDVLAKPLADILHYYVKDYYEMLGFIFTESMVGYSKKFWAKF